MGGSVAVVSGGLDSVTALFLYAGRNPGASPLVLTFDYGQPAAPMETASAAFFASALNLRHRVIQLPWMAPLLPGKLNAGKSSDDAVWVPNRNGVFIAVAAAVAENMHRTDVIMGFNQDEALSFPDGSPAFVETTNRALSFSTGGRVSVVSPTLDLTKPQMAAMLNGLNIDPSHLWSCYGPGELHCGVCPSCVRLFDALQAADVPPESFPEKAPP